MMHATMGAGRSAWGNDFGANAPPSMSFTNHSQSVSRDEVKSATRSCTTCYKAKAKCVRKLGEQNCERCTRLKKECLSKEPVLRRKKASRTSRAAQLENLEQKIEHLVNALAASKQPSATFGQPSPPLSYKGDAPEPRKSSQDELLESMCGAPEVEEDAEASHRASLVGSPASSYGRGHRSSTPASSCRPSEIEALGVPLPTAEMLFQRYQKQMAAGLPFVVVPPEVTAEVLYAEKPLLLHAIVVVASYDDLARQQSLVKHLMRSISERILMRNEKNIGILQALLVFVAWYHPHIFWGQQVTNLLHLAIAMATDLGIERPTTCTVSEFKTIKRSMHGPTGSKWNPRESSLEDHRTYAGLFYLTSMLASSFKKMDAVTYSKYLETCLEKLEQQREYDSDLLAVQMVRLQHLCEDTHAVEAPTGPPSLYIKAFESELSRLRQADPCAGIASLQGNIFLQLQYAVTDILIQELALSDLHDIVPGGHPRDSPLLALTSENTRQSLQNLRCHLDHLYNCLDAIKRFTNLYFTIPTSQYLTLPFSVFGQFAHSFIVLVKIASLDLEGWDMRTAHPEMDFPSVIEQACLRYDEAGTSTSELEGLKINNDSFAKWSQRLRWMKQVFEAKFNPQAPVPNLAVGSVASDKCNLPSRPEATRALLRPSAEYNAEILGEAQQGWPDQTIIQQQQQQQQPTPAQSEDAMLSGGDFFSNLNDDFWSNFPMEFDLNFGDVVMGNSVLSP